MKRSIKICILLALLIALTFCIVHWAFFDIQRISGQQLLQEYHSPLQQYTLSIYLNDGGATVAYSVLGTVTDHATGKSRNLYWQYPCWDATVQWLDEQTVTINGVQLDVTKDVYDYRHADEHH